MDRRFGFGTRAVLIKVFIDNFIGLPFIDLPSFYLCTLGPRVGLSEAAHRLRVDWWPSMQMGLCAWVSLPRRPVSPLFWMRPPRSHRRGPTHRPRRSPRRRYR